MREVFLNGLCFCLFVPCAEVREYDWTQQSVTCACVKEKRESYCYGNVLFLVGATRGRVDNTTKEEEKRGTVLI